MTSAFVTLLLFFCLLAFLPELHSQPDRWEICWLLLSSVSREKMESSHLRYFCLFVSLKADTDISHIIAPSCHSNPMMRNYDWMVYVLWLPSCAAMILTTNLLQLLLFLMNIELYFINVSKMKHTKGFLYSLFILLFVRILDIMSIKYLVRCLILFQSENGILILLEIINLE